MELKDTKTLVENLLREYPALRGNDDFLYCEVIKNIYPNILNFTAEQFFYRRKDYKIPSFESVRRSRAKIMEEHPDLKPCEKVQKGREIQREKYYDLATNWKDLKQQSFDF